MSVVTLSEIVSETLFEIDVTGEVNLTQVKLAALVRSLLEEVVDTEEEKELWKLYQRILSDKL